MASVEHTQHTTYTHTHTQRDTLTRCDAHYICESERVLCVYARKWDGTVIDGRTFRQRVLLRCGFSVVSLQHDSFYWLAVVCGNQLGVSLLGRHRSKTGFAHTAIAAYIGICSWPIPYTMRLPRPYTCVLCVVCLCVCTAVSFPPVRQACHIVGLAVDGRCGRNCRRWAR